MIKQFMIAFGVAFLATGPAAAADVFGFWLVESKRAIVEIKPCGASACGEIVWTTSEPEPGEELLTHDTNNPDASLHSRTICGLPLIGDFVSDGRGGWKKGFIYDPSEGKTYKSKMSLLSDNELTVRGFVGVSLLGRSQTWVRQADARGGC